MNDGREGRLFRFSKWELWILYEVLRNRAQVFAYGRRLLGELLEEMHSRGMVTGFEIPTPDAELQALKSEKL